MTAIVSSTGKTRTCAQQRSVMRSRLQGLRQYLGCLTALVDPANNFGALFGSIPAGQAVAFDMGQRYHATIRRTREEARLDWGTAYLLKQMEPLIAAIATAEQRAIPRDPQEALRALPRTASVRIKGHALAAEWERSLPAEMFLPTLRSQGA